jgi:hypothetical protein
VIKILNQTGEHLPRGVDGNLQNSIAMSPIILDEWSQSGTSKKSSLLVSFIIRHHLLTYLDHRKEECSFQELPEEGIHSTSAGGAVSLSASSKGRSSSLIFWNEGIIHRSSDSWRKASRKLN